MREYYLVVIFDTISKYAIRVTLSYVHPAVVAFMGRYKEFTCKGVVFKENDDYLQILPRFGKIVGEVQGLSGLNPRRSVVIQSQDPDLLPILRSELIIALEEFMQTIKQFQTAPNENMKHIYTPMVIGSNLQGDIVTDNSTANFIDKYATKLLGNSTQVVTKHYNNTPKSRIKNKRKGNKT